MAAQDMAAALPTAQHSLQPPVDWLHMSHSPIAPACAGHLRQVRGGHTCSTWRSRGALVMFWGDLCA